MGGGRWCGLGAALLLLACLCEGQLLREELTDATFEHTTQAASGQTTGVWLVSFCSPTATSCKHLEAEGWARLRKELHEQQVFLSKVDVHLNHMLRERFEVSHLPTILLFRERKMFRYAGRPGDMEQLRRFALESYTEAEALEVPPLPSAFDWLVKRVRRHTAVVQHALSVGDHRLLAQAVLPSLVMLLVIAGFVFAATRKTKED